MAVDGHLVELLACPRCDQPLADAGDDGLNCPGCRTAFPLLDGVPWLFADPDNALAEWRERLNFSLASIRRDGELAAAALRDGSPADPTRRRLSARAEACRACAVEIEELLAPLALAAGAASYETYLALRTRLPTEVSLTGYEANLHRDWCWGEEENRLSRDAVLAGLAGETPRRLLVLGAGAGRLAYDVHMALDDALTVALDFNPLLVLAAARICRGHPVAMHEFPMAPRRLEDAAIARELSAPAPARAGLEFLLASALRPPFRDGAFDAVLTPWLVDVLDEDLRVQAARWNRLLADGGRWVWFGSAAFRSPSPAACYSLEEALEIIAESGFGEPDVSETEIPYMANPASRHARRERVVTVVATKAADAARPARHVALPDWIVTGKEPVPALESFRVQAMSTRIHAFIMGMIDGKRSIRDMAALLEKQRLMTREEGEAAVRGFLIKMYEESRRTTGL